MKKLIISILISIFILNGCSNKMDDTLSNLNSKIDKINSELNNSIKQLEEKDSKIEDLNNEIESKNKELSNFKSIPSTHESDLESYKNELKIRDNQLKLLNAMIDYYKKNSYIDEFKPNFSNPTNKPYHNADANDITEISSTENLDMDSFLTTELDKSKINKIPIDLIGKYQICDSIFIDDNTVLFNINDYSNEYKEDIFYKYDIKNEELSIFHIDNDFNISQSYSKVLNNGNIAFGSKNKILIFEKDSLKLKKSINYKELNTLAYISNNGDKLVYRTQEGMIISSLEFENPTLIIKRTGKDPDGMDSIGAVKFKWSKDDKHIAYTLSGYEWTYGVGLINTENYNYKFYKFPDYHLNDFLSDNKSILAVFGFDSQAFSIIDSENNIEKKFSSDEFIYGVSEVSDNNKNIFIQYYKEGKYTTYILDIENQEKIQVNIDDIYFNFKDWNQSSNKAIILNHSSKELYIIDMNN